MTTDPPGITVVPAQPERRILEVVQCFFCGKKWTAAKKPYPAHDEVRIEEGFCPNGCEVEAAFFGRKGKKR